MDQHSSLVTHHSALDMLRVETSSGSWSAFCEQILAFLKADLIRFNVDGKPVVGFRSPDSRALWIRDHADMLRAGKYFLEDVQSAVQCFADTQAANGRLFDFVTPYPIAPPGARENWETWVRVPVEADVEYRFVKAGYLAWQASGDDEWMLGLLPAFERALLYSMRHPDRWDPNLQLIKRAYTIDTWDFDYTAGRAPWLNFQIDENTFWGIMHGDNSGFYESLRLLAKMFRVAGQHQKAVRIMNVAQGVRERANKTLFNGSFYTHFHKISEFAIEGVDESRQLSLSNPMAINRGMATHDIAVAILNEYRERQAATNAFAEWFSIDPPFPDGIFGDEKLVAGAYCNGGIMPLVGGELAMAALNHGQESYGISILQQYRKMIAESGETYLWYFPDGTPSSVENSTSPEALPTDGWGSSAMLYAFVEGLCGIEDLDNSLSRVRCSPRWTAAGEDEANVQIEYAASGASFGYRYRYEASEQAVKLTLEAPNTEVDLQLLLPEGQKPAGITWNGQNHKMRVSTVEGSIYLEAHGSVVGEAAVEVQLIGSQG